MAGYFSFHRLITTTIVKAVYFLGFLALTAAGTTLIVWAGMRLHNANIARQLGWRYVAIGAAAIVVGNLAWRVICEFWIVLFNINAHLALMDNTVNLGRVQRIPATQFVERRASTKDRRFADNRVDVVASPDTSSEEKEKLKAQRPVSVLGLS